LNNTFAIFSVCFSAVSSSRVIHTIRVLLHDSGIIVVVGGGMNTITVTSASSITVSITDTPTRINA
jgi:hypothetical protein